MTTSTEHPNAALMRDFFAAFGEADRERLARLMSPDLVWHFPGTSAIAGDWRGVDGLLDGVRAIAMTLGGQQSLRAAARDRRRRVRADRPP